MKNLIFVITILLAGCAGVPVDQTYKNIKMPESASICSATDGHTMVVWSCK